MAGMEFVILAGGGAGCGIHASLELRELRAGLPGFPRGSLIAVLLQTEVGGTTRSRIRRPSQAGERRHTTDGLLGAKAFAIGAPLLGQLLDPTEEIEDVGIQYLCVVRPVEALDGTECEFALLRPRLKGGRREPVRPISDSVNLDPRIRSAWETPTRTYSRGGEADECS